MAEVPFYDLAPAVRERRERLHRALDTVIDGGYFVGGSPVADFEGEFARFLGVGHCIGVGNGLDGLRIGLEGLGIVEGDEVIVPGFTFFASWLAVMQTGATPVPVDVTVHTASIDVSAIAAAITPRTKAVMAVHLYGIPADLGALRSLADEAGIFLIEDAAQSHGARSGAAMTGSVGDVSSFSFYPTKNLGALGDGGMIATNSEKIAAIARSRRSYGQGATKYDHVDTGWNSRLDTLQAAFLSDALTELDLRNRRRRAIASVYLDALGSDARAVLGSSRREENVWHHFVLRARDRDRVRGHFDDRGVRTDIHYPYYFHGVAPMDRYGRTRELPNSETLSRQVLSFPISPWLTDLQVAQVAEGFAALPRDLVAG